jgi:hypothetical protein
MAGLIAVGDSGEEEWHAANWAFSFLLQAVRELLPVGDQLRGRIEAADRSFLGFLSLRDVAGDELVRFAEAVASHRNDLAARGPSAFASPEFFANYLESVGLLLSVLTDAAERRQSADP